ncbi:flavin reductase family protein [Gimesia maris]|uniref:flavin reductase family protein n=1 Tax=Gimesia maris TaxID=122 RepID=UPI00241D5BE5|nr:flavin reductase family protein [Gimesia maris]|tara:strand:- start:17248 stop:17850 length:603 start_codon:yes stop_codon:yes gene_type:complete
MELDFEAADLDRAYAVLSSLVTPRPIAWVTSLDEAGVVNAAPFSFFNVLGAHPPIVGFCPGNRDDGTPKDTAINVRKLHEFVVNLVDESLAEQMNQTAASLPYGVSEVEAAGMEVLPSSTVKPPRLAAAPASLECAEWGTLQIGDNRLVIGLVKRVHIQDQYWEADTMRIKSEELRLIGRMARPSWYCRTTDRFEMERPQ